MDEWQPIAETAEMLGINSRRIYQLLDKGRIPVGTAMKVTRAGHAPKKVRAVRASDVLRHLPEPFTRKLPDIQHDLRFATEVLGMTDTQAREWVARGYQIRPKYARRLLEAA